MALSTDILKEKNKIASPYAWLVLLEITLTDGTVFRLVRNNEDVVFTTDSDDSLVGHWKMNDDDANLVVVDSSDNANNGAADVNTDTINDTGKINDALNMSLNGGSHYITVPDQSYYSFGDGITDSPFSIAGWVYTPAVSGNLETVIAKANSSIDGEWILRRQGLSGLMVFTLIDSDGDRIVVISSTLSIGWHHIVCTYDGSSSETGLNMYIDNVLDNSVRAETGTYTAMSAGALAVTIGTEADLGSRWPDKFDDVRVYNKELSAGERTVIYNSDSGTENMPVTYTAFNFQLEPTVLNSKGQIPTLTLRVSNVTSLIQSKLQALNGAIGSTVKMMVVNSNLLAEDFSDLEMNFEVLAANSSNMWVEFILGAPSPLRQRFPLNKFGALHCNWIFEGAQCSYDRKTIAGVTLSNPVSLEITDHKFIADEAITLYTVNGITGTIEGNYLIKAATDGNNVTIKTLAEVDVDGADFGGSYTSGGKAGYTSCKRTLTDCRLRENSTRFGGFPGMRSGGVRIA